MASSRSVNTMQELLQRMMTDISLAKALPDADLEFLVNLETVILTKLREPVDAMGGQLQGGGPTPAPPGGPMPGGPPMSGPPIGPGGPNPVPGVMPSPGGAAGAPNPDELRRMVGGGQ